MKQYTKDMLILHNCDLCNVELCDGNKLPNRKCMEHNHDTGEFRNIVCNSCNCKKTDK
jgi:hypothetical protein